MSELIVDCFAGENPSIDDELSGRPEQPKQKRVLCPICSGKGFFENDD